MESAWKIFSNLFSDPQINRILLKAYVINIDKYGQELLALGAEMEMSRALYSKINWKNISLGMLERLLEEEEHLKWYPAIEKQIGW